MAGRMMPTPAGQPVDLSLQLSVKQLTGNGSSRPPKPPVLQSGPRRQDSCTLSQASSTRSFGGKSPTAAEEAGGQAMRRRVYFCPTPMNSHHAVTPYGLKYGKHPSFFDFNRRGEMQLNDAGVSDEIKKDEEKTKDDDKIKRELVVDSPAEKVGAH